MFGFQTMSGAPSPTVNTREAMRIVMGMFNTSLEMGKATNSDDVQMDESEPPAQAAGRRFFYFFLPMIFVVFLQF
jgi:hypothetical protein